MARTETRRPPPPWAIWLMAARPATLPAAIVPVIVGTAAAGGVSHSMSFLAALFAAIFIQVGTNFANDLFDFRRGADTATRLGPRRVTQSGLVTPRQVAIATGVAFGIAALFGVYLVATSGWLILVIGVLSILSGIAYTGGPWPLGYHGLGDLFVFVFFGLVAVLGSTFIQIGRIMPLAIAAAVPVGLLVTAILIVNNLRDIDTDRLAGKGTLAVRFGRRFTRYEYATFLSVPYLVPILLRLAGLVGPWFWLPILSIPLAFRLVRIVGRTSDSGALNRVLKQTGQLHLLYGLLFAASLLA